MAVQVVRGFLLGSRRNDHIVQLRSQPRHSHITAALTASSQRRRTPADKRQGDARQGGCNKSDASGDKVWGLAWSSAMALTFPMRYGSKKPLTVSMVEVMMPAMSAPLGHSSDTCLRTACDCPAGLDLHDQGGSYTPEGRIIHARGSDFRR